ncbi:hypothetical protein TNCT_568441 [Trichonephila clavata]|uniref:Uncharacterized protein n=1 Tax=Trichonephila clavata TaxID=2740835 RepID=A0A8X6GV29_TRICU|nr:hypothetical protein TNCT_36401 [Trichonephila clavata]GFR10021.1 hypothetical protein TNCT_568441 [Trichonephila clavata]
MAFQIQNSASCEVLPVIHFLKAKGCRGYSQRYSFHLREHYGSGKCDGISPEVEPLFMTKTEQVGHLRLLITFFKEQRSNP